MKKLKQIHFMSDKLIRDLKSPKPRYPITEDLHSKDLGEYYFIFDEKRVASGADQPLIKKNDENGIPINKTYVDVKNQEYVYFPISIGQMGLAVFHTYLKTKNEKDKERFLKFSEWFADEKNYHMDNRLGIRWLTDVPLPQYKNKGLWQSAFSQSRGISILVRGYQLTSNHEWSQKAWLAMKSFRIPVAEGGVTSFTDKGPFYEEYTAEKPTLVLNGKIFALCGIYDYLRVFPDDEMTKTIFDDGIKTLENILPEYDLGYWSRYNLCRAEWYPSVDPATIGYQRLHVTQLNMLYQLTGKEIFKKYAEIFSKQDTLSNALKMYIEKYKALKKIGRL
ncbi:MAG: D-glucuronyl C5-epimerase family protein [Candidatus Marinimicrobia bacterium]|nr:D-glucuronyl C5-epimerase family protein [Candidatus Neomarinimicrobiota bacterium]